MAKSKGRDDASLVATEVDAQAFAKSDTNVLSAWLRDQLAGARDKRGLAWYRSWLPGVGRLLAAATFGSTILYGAFWLLAGLMLALTTLLLILLGCVGAGLALIWALGNKWTAGCVVLLLVAILVGGWNTFQ